MSISKWLDQTQKSISQHYDVVIVGAGIAGLSTAYWLLKRDSKLRIAVIEKDRVGFGASGRNAGFVTCGSTEHFMKLSQDFGLEKAVEIWKFSEENHRLLSEEIIQDRASKVDYKKTGSCTVAPNQAQWEKYQSTAVKMSAAAIDVREVNSSEMQKDYGITGFLGGIEYSGDGYIDPIKLLNLLRSKIKVDLFEQTEVFALNKQEDHELVQTDKGQFRAEKVILTLNAYLPLLLPQFEGLVVPGRGQILMTEPLPPFVRGPCYLTQHLCYFRQLPSGHLLVGGFRNLAKETELTYADQTTDVIQKALFQFIQDHFKFGAQARIAYQWSGIMGFTPDGQMVLGSLPGRENLHLMAGCSGHGMGLSFHAAQTLVDSLHGKAIPEHLRIERFKIPSSF